MNLIWLTIFIASLIVLTNVVDIFMLNKKNMFNKLKKQNQIIKDKKIKNLESENHPEEKKILDKVEAISTSEYAQYTVLDYSIRILSYPEETTRYYAVVSLTGGKLKDNIANLIIHYTGANNEADKENLLNYGLIKKQYNNPYIPLTIFDYNKWCYTFDAVKRMLNEYIKDKNNGEERIGSDYWKAYYKEDAYYFDSKEDALYALCQFKKVIDERYRKKALSVNDISETEIKVTFTD